MTMADADFMLELKNYPETRLFAIWTKDEIQRDDHLNWLGYNVISFQVAESNGERIGAVRINRGEISIWIARKHWGFGVATEIIKRVSESGMFAKIVDGNVASFRAFVKAGFLPKIHKDNYYILEKP